MMPYHLAVDYRALVFLQGLSRNDQRQLHGRFVDLSDYPHNLAHRTVTGEDGRDYFINAGGKYAIKYWIDPAVKEVRILDIQLVRFTP